VQPAETAPRIPGAVSPATKLDIRLRGRWRAADSGPGIIDELAAIARTALRRIRRIPRACVPVRHTNRGWGKGEARTAEATASGIRLAVTDQAGDGDGANTQEPFQRHTATGARSQLPGNGIKSLIIHVHYPFSKENAGRPRVISMGDCQHRSSHSNGLQSVSFGTASAQCRRASGHRKPPTTVVAAR
jgi:hypothetical protein